MRQGIILTLGVIVVIASRILYGCWDIRLGFDKDNNATGWFAVVSDIVGTLMIVLSLLSYFKIV